MGLLLFVGILALAVVIGNGYAEEKDEPGLLWRLLGYAVLGFFVFTLQRVPLPIGYPIAWYLASRVEVNRRARLAAATTTFVIWLVFLII